MVIYVLYETEILEGSLKGSYWIQAVYLSIVSEFHSIYVALYNKIYEISPFMRPLTWRMYWKCDFMC